jgi:hypothetical protein
MLELQKEDTDKRRHKTASLLETRHKTDEFCLNDKSLPLSSSIDFLSKYGG